MEKAFKYWFPVVIWSIVIFSFSARSVPSTSDFFWKDFVVKKTAHLVEYGILAVLLYRAFVSYGRSKKEALIYSLVIAVVYAASDEFHQSFVSGRDGRLRDVIIDTMGASGALYLVNSRVWQEKS